MIFVMEKGDNPTDVQWHVTEGKNIEEHKEMMMKLIEESRDLTLLSCDTLADGKGLYMSVHSDAKQKTMEHYAMDFDIPDKDNQDDSEESVD